MNVQSTLTVSCNNGRALKGLTIIFLWLFTRIKVKKKFFFLVISATVEWEGEICIKIIKQKIFKNYSLQKFISVIFSLQLFCTRKDWGGAKNFFTIKHYDARVAYTSRQHLAHPVKRTAISEGPAKDIRHI